MRRAVWRAAAALIVASAVSGCLAPARYERPDLPAGIGWQAKGEEGRSRPSSPDAWWTAFGDPALDALVSTVLAHNNDVLAASLRARRALLQAGLTEEAGRPKLSGGLSSSRTMTLTNERLTSKQVGSSLGLSYDIDLWGRLAAQRDMAGLEARASQEDIEAARLTVVAAAVSTWWRLAHANHMLQSAMAELAVTRRIAAIVATMRSAQTVSELETLEITQAIEAQLGTLEGLKHDRDAQRVALAVLLNGAPAPATEPKGLSAGPLPALESGLPASLIGRRPDLRAAELRLRASLRETDEKKASFYPAISLNGDLAAGGIELAELLANPTASLATSLNLPFLNISEMRLQIRVSQAQYEEAVVAFRATMLTALSEVADGLSTRQSLARQTRHLARALDLQRRIESIYETRLRAGSIALRAFLDTQQQTRRAENALIENRLARLLNEATLYRALGGSPVGDASASSKTRASR